MYNSSKSSIHLITVSFIIYLFVNLFENMIHYNIGKFSDHETKFDIPTRKDWFKIIIVMCTFALIQGILTYVFN
jgi:hypothetical protein